jgi:hypothetical protein
MFFDFFTRPGEKRQRLEEPPLEMIKINYTTMWWLEEAKKHKK